MCRKIIVVIVIVLVVLLLVAGSLKNIVATKILTKNIEDITGLKVDIGSVNTGLFRSFLDIKDLKLFNPSSFSDEVMIEIPQLYVDYALNDLIRGKVHLQQLIMDLKEIIIAKNGKKDLNLNSLKVAQPQEDVQDIKIKKEEPKDYPFQIDILKIKVGKVIYKNYSKGDPPRIREFDINIEEYYRDITDSSILMGLILTKVFLTDIKVARLVHPDIGYMREEIAEAIKKADSLVAEDIIEELERGKDKIDEIDWDLDKLLPSAL